MTSEVVIDVRAKEISIALLEDKKLVELHKEQPGGQYEEEGYAAYDDTDGDLTSQVEISVNGDIVRYRVSDSAGNVAIRFRKIPYADTSSESSESGDTSELPE